MLALRGKAVCPIYCPVDQILISASLLSHCGFSKDTDFLCIRIRCLSVKTSQREVGLLRHV